VFIRLHGCNLRCTFCDTRFSDPDDPIVSVDALVEQVARVGGESASLVVITGGEPLRQNIIPLLVRLMRNGFTSQIETAGTYWLPALNHLAEIVCSPKTPVIDKDIYATAAAFKYVISASMELEGYIPVTATQPGARPALLALPRPRSPVFLSPMDEQDADKNRANRRRVAELALRYGVRAGVQLHKVLEIQEPQ
jgi:organic radical activating enzyme